MKPFLCSRCGGMRFILSDTESDGVISARCVTCGLEVNLRRTEEK